MDESTDMTDTAQLPIFIRGVDSDLSITEEILDIKLMHGTTSGKDVFENVCQSVTKMKLSWNKLVGLTTDVRWKKWVHGEDASQDAGRDLDW